MRRIFAAIAPFWLAAATLLAQSVSSVVGTVRDSSGAVMAGVKVTAVNEGTGIAYQATTNESGDYVLATLPLGNYTFTFQVAAFQEQKVQGIEVHVGSTVRQDATLAPAGVATRVEVVESTPLVNSETSELGSLVYSEQIHELPLNGRRVYSLLALTAGTQTGDSTTRPVVAGGRAGFTRFRVDGIDVNSHNTVSALVQPSADAVAEFRAETEMAPASEASSSGVAVVLKSGTNAFHGSLFDFLRNNVLDAHPFFERQIQAPGFNYMRNQLRYNQFGGTLGGPVRKEKTFFFFSFEGLRQRTAQQVTGLYPTAAMLAGDFTGVNPVTGKAMKVFGPVFDPKTLLPFPGNRIPADRIHPFAQKFNPFIPAANCLDCLAAGLGFDAIGNSPGYSNYNEWIGRLDHRFSSRDSLTGSLDVRPANNSSSPSVSPVSRNKSTGTTYLATMNETRIFTPSLINDFRAGFVRQSSTSTQQRDAGGAFPFLNTPFNRSDLFPTVTISSFTAQGNSAAGLSTLFVEEAYNALDTVSYTHGKHQIKAGLEFRRDHLWNVSYESAVLFFLDNLPPQYGYTGTGFADYLLGYPVNGLTFQGTGKANMVKRSVFGSFIQDDWKVNSRLTLNLGLRWEYAQRWRDKDTSLNRLGTLDLGPESRAIGGRFLLGGSSNVFVPGKGVLSAGSGPLIRGELVDPAWRDFMPRIGFAFRPFNNNKTAIRGGYGMYFTIPDAASVVFETAAPPYYYFDNLVNLPPQQPLGKPLSVDKFFPLGGPAATGAVGSNPRNRDPRVYEWSFGIQHEVRQNVLLSAEYVGNRGQKLPFTLFVNEPPLPNAAQLAQLKANPSLDTTLAQLRAPFSAIGPQFQYDDHIANSWYNSLNVKVEGRFGTRLNYSAVYSFSKALDQASGEQKSIPTTTTNLALNKSYADFDHPRRFVANWVYQLPFGNQLWAPSNAALKKIVDGWEVTGIASFEAGPPYNITMGSDTSFRGGALPVYPILNGLPQTSDIRATNGIYLTQANFQAPPFGQLGTLARNAFHGPGINNFDLGLLKNFAITESKRIQFRGEMFNAFNHPQFSFGGGSLLRGIAAPPKGSTDPVLQWVDPSQFGRAGARGSRVIQFGLKFLW